VDYWGVAAAIYRRARGGRLTGASTLTQQLVKNLLQMLRQKRGERGFDAKAEEWLFAWELTRTMSKDQVLELYLNTVFFGNNRYGVEAAMQYYFGHSAKEATLREASILVSLVKGANNYVGGRTEKEKEEHRKKLENRSAYVLGRMVKHQTINQAQADAAVKEPINLIEVTGEQSANGINPPAKSEEDAKLEQQKRFQEMRARLLGADQPD
jgi:membrane peptidoglycan carboxypeptidase